MDKDKIGPKEAADVIRADYQHEHVEPHFHHQVRFANDVLTEMGEEKSPENVARVMRLLDKNGIEGHAYADFPKWVKNERGESAVVDDEDEESAFMSRPEQYVDGEPNPEYGHIDPNNGKFVQAGQRDKTYQPHKLHPPIYEPGAVPVFETGGQKGPEAPPVSDDPNASHEDVLRVRQGNITKEPARKPNPPPPTVDATS